MSKLRVKEYNKEKFQQHLSMIYGPCLTKMAAI